jgi:hypothetical protein
MPVIHSREAEASGCPIRDELLPDSHLLPVQLMADSCSLSFNTHLGSSGSQQQPVATPSVQLVEDSCQMSVQFPTKSVVSVAEMARMCGLSRARFYQLMNEGVFPPPVYDIETRRPFYTEDMQAVCLEVRKRNCGVNGRPVLFYAARHPLGSQPKPTDKAKAKNKPTTNGRHNDLIDALRTLGLEPVSAAQVESAVKELFPGGIQQVDSGEVIRAVFLHLKRRNTADNVG